MNFNGHEPDEISYLLEREAVRSAFMAYQRLCDVRVDHPTRPALRKAMLAAKERAAKALVIIRG